MGAFEVTIIAKCVIYVDAESEQEAHDHATENVDTGDFELLESTCRQEVNAEAAESAKRHADVRMKAY